MHPVQRIPSHIRTPEAAHQTKVGRGFALIISLVLMAFMVLLIVSLTSLVRMEVTVSTQSESVQRARQNALFGLKAALGTLQEELGPDRRISAIATRLDNDPYDTDDFDVATGTLQIDGVKQDRQLWTGVWETSVDTEGFVDTTFRRWLISGYPETHNAAEGDALANATDFPERVELVSGPNPIEAGLVELTTEGDTTGGYAFWIGDEGVKAKANLTAGSSPISAQRLGIETMRDLDWFANSSDSIRSRLSDYASFEALTRQATGSNTIAPEHFHDLTFSSYGVLANTRDAGLRKDLTTGLYDSTTEPAGLIFGTADGSAPSVNDPGGPAWNQLRSWLALQPDPVSGDLPIQPSTAEQAGAYPVITVFQCYVLPSIDASGRIYLHMMPAVVLWNPYTVPLEDTELILSFLRPGDGGSSMNNETNIWYRWHKMELKDRDGNKLTFNGNDFASLNFSESLTLYLNSGRIEPGQAIVYSPPAEQRPYDPSALSPTTHVLERGYRMGYGYYVDTGFEVNPMLGPYTYKLYGDGKRANTFRLFKAATSGPELLQTTLYQHDFPLMRHYDSNVFTTLPSLPSGPFQDTTYAVGFKSMRNFVGNEKFWDDTKITLPPSSHKWLSQLNPRAQINGPTPLVYGGNINTVLSPNPSFSSNGQFGGDDMHIGVTPWSGDIVSVGSVNGNLIDNVSLFQPAPVREELFSIGQLTHAPLYNEYDNGATYKQRVLHSRFGNLIPAYAIGNSQASRSIELDETERYWDGSYTPEESDFDFKGVLHDYSYKLNDALWDGYFFSTLPNTAAHNTPENSRLIAVTDAGAEPRSDYDAAAADLMLDGAFNVNSTSVEAWRALLASFYGTDVTRQSGAVDTADPANPTSPILRYDKPVGPAIDSVDNLLSDSQYNGYRQLSPQEIELLAQAIVEEIKVRGPFGSLSQFINRMPNRQDNTFSEPTDAFRLQGTLSAAIEKADLNDRLQTANVAAHTSGMVNTEAKAEAGWTTEGLPGWLTQADLLARLGGTLSARSDTFRIRAYGENINAMTGEKTIARCEAIVQRLPEFVEASANVAEADFDDLTTTNRQLGRRFVVVSFRWLENDEL